MSLILLDNFLYRIAELMHLYLLPIGFEIFLLGTFKFSGYADGHVFEKQVNECVPLQHFSVYQLNLVKQPHGTQNQITENIILMHVPC